MTTSLSKTSCTRTTKKADRIFKLRQELLEIRELGMKLMYRTGLILKEIRDKELWKSGYDSFASFYSDPEIGMRKDSVSRAIKIVENFNIKEIADIPARKMYAILPHLTEKNKEKMVEMATSLSYGDLKHELMVNEVIASIPTMINLPRIYPCNVCGGVKGVSWEMLCHCGWTPAQIEYVGKLIDKVDFGGEL